MQPSEGAFKVERHRQIWNIVNSAGSVTVSELCSQFGVSEATIRRDLAELHRQGLIRRTHGGAVSVLKAPKEPPLFRRLNEHVREKQMIGKTAARLIVEGETIFLGSGTTVVEVARNLPQDIQITVITNSVPIINELVSHPRIDLIVIGGVLRKSELSMVGHVAEQSVREFRVKKAFMGMYGIDVKAGFTSDYPPEIMTDRAIMDTAQEVIILADHSKFGRISSMLVAPVTAAQIIITDSGTPGDIVEELQDLGIRVILAGGEIDGRQKL